MKKTKKLILSIIAAVACTMLASTLVKAAPFENKEFNLAQPDGTKVKVIGTGDEYYQHMESLDGHTVIRNNKGWICYAELNDEGTELVSTDKVYTGDDSNAPDDVEKHVEPSEEKVEEKALAAKRTLEKDNKVKKTSSLFKTKAQSVSGPVGKVVGLTVLVSFTDEAGTMNINEIGNYFNQTGYNGFGNNGSVHDYFYDISKGRLNYTNKVVGYYTAKYSKSHYDDENRSCGDAGVELLQEIDQWINEHNIDISGVSKNDDGTLKMLTVMYAGQPNSGWLNGLWEHTSIGSFRGKSNQRYTLTSIGNELSLGITCHETAHCLLGYPDLYRYDVKSNTCPVVDFCLMGKGINKKNPVPPNPYFTNVLSGYGSVNDLNNVAANTTVSLYSRAGGSSTVYKWTNNQYLPEYYLLQNIQSSGRYTGVGESGILVWHIDQHGDNAYPPTMYSNNNKRYLVSIIEADGRNHLEFEMHSMADFFSSSTKTSINSTSTPNAVWHNGDYSGLNISDISAAGSRMTFKKLG